MFHNQDLQLELYQISLKTLKIILYISKPEINCFDNKSLIDQRFLILLLE